MKLKKIFAIMLIVLMISFVSTISYALEGPNDKIADVGSFESYDSSWDSGGSSWDSGSSWDFGSSSSSSYDSDYDGDGSGLMGFIIFLIIIAIIIYYGKNKGSSTPQTSSMPRTHFNTGSSGLVEQQVKAVDPLFNKEVFLSWARTLFIKLQEAWAARDWETIRTFESVELFEQHKKQLQGYIDNHQINVMERIAVLGVELESFTQNGDKDILTCILRSRMNDYIIDDRTRQLIKGEKNKDIYGTYKLTFVRKTGVKTQAGTAEVNKTNCPNCGAPTEITSSGRCEYCGSVITTGEHDWVLSDLTRLRN